MSTRVDPWSLATCLMLVPPLSGCSEDAVGVDEGPGTTTHAGGSETDPSTAETETGSETTDNDDSVCGDGVVDPGEACDDSNEDDSDGCTAGCEFGPCAWELVRRDPALNAEDGWYVVLPMVLDGEQALIAHATDPAGERGTRLVRASTIDGSIAAAVDLDVAPGDDVIYGLALDPSGDVFLGHSRLDLGQVEVRRLSPDGEELWLYTHEADGYLAGLAYAANGEVVVVDSIEVGAQDRDALIIGVDPADGSERWSQTYSGPLAGNNNSLDLGGGLVVDEQGRRFVATNEYRDWDTLTPVIAAYAPGDSGEPLWVSGVDMPSKQQSILALALGPAGSVVVGSVVINSSTQPFIIASFDAETGALLWSFERDQIEGDFSWSAIRGLAASEDRLMAVGYWTNESSGEPTLEAYALGLNPDGTRACLATLTGADLGQPGLSLLPSALRATASGFHVAGFTASEGPAIELLQAKIR